MTHFPKDIPPDILSRADDLLSAKYGTDRPIDPEIVELVCRGMMVEQERNREAFASWMMANGFATGHGDTLEMLLTEAAWQVQELRAKAIRGTK